SASFFSRSSHPSPPPPPAACRSSAATACCARPPAGPPGGRYATSAAHAMASAGSPSPAPSAPSGARAVRPSAWTSRAARRSVSLIARVAGTVAARPLLRCAHMGTVSPGEGVCPVIEDDVIRSDGTTVLGGDDKSGIAIVCECVRVCRERQLRHPPLDVVFTVCEEVGLLGARHLDLGRIRARRGLVFDSDAVGLAFTR